MSRKNYTEREKRELLTIVEKYKTIIENKSTNAVTVEKKSETWQIIAQQYNASAEHPRTAKQLSTAYQNLKRITRQKTAENNNQNYIEKKIQIDVKKFKKDKAEDKKAIMATGGGTFTPQLSEVGAQMLALMGDQVIPLNNNCDSATDYFKKDEDKSNEVIIDIDMIQELDDHKIQTSPEPPLNNPEIQPKQLNSSTGCRRINNPQQLKKPTSRHTETRSIQLKQKKKVETTCSIKRKFYKKKLECALLEKKNKTC